MIFGFSDFEVKFEVRKRGKPFDPKPVISLFEGEHCHGHSTKHQPSLTEAIVKEQMRLMSLGKSKEDALTAAIGVVCASNKGIVIKPKASLSHDLLPYLTVCFNHAQVQVDVDSEQNKDGISQLEKAVMEMHKILSSK